MPLFSFEVLGPDGSNLVADKRDLPSSAEVWGHLEVSFAVIGMCGCA